MKLLFYTAAGDAAAWIDALRRALPAARIELWPAAAANAADYALLWKPPPELIGDLKHVKAVFYLGAGVDAVAGDASLPPGVRLVRLEDAGMAEQMAEYVCYAVLRRYREFDAYAEQQRAGLWQPRHRTAKEKFGVAILGLGVLGTAVASALAAFGFPLRSWSRTRKQMAGVATFAGASELETFLSDARVVVCLLPLTRDTNGLLDRALLTRLPRGAYIVNVSRGALVVDDDLLALLDSGHLAGAMLDVFHDEPLPPEHRFWHHPRVVLTPHISACTQVDESVAQIADKIRRIEAGLPITGIVARDQGY